MPAMPIDMKPLPAPPPGLPPIHVTVKMPPALEAQITQGVFVYGATVGFVGGLLLAFILYLIFRAKGKTP